MLVWGVGCSAPALPPGYHEAERLERAGRLEAARDRYAEAARSCRLGRKACATTALRAAQMEERLGRVKPAVAAYLRVARGVGRGLAQGARALERAARILAKGGQWGRAEPLFWRVIDAYPETLAADDALEQIVRWYRSHGRQRALVPKLRRRYRRLERQDIADNLLFEAARILAASADLRDQDLAVRLLRRLVSAYRESGLRDNAWMLAASIRERQGRYQDAVSLYQELLATREDAFGGASYHSEFLDDALLAVGRIRWLRLGRPDRAITAFRELVDTLPSSVLRDDALLRIVLVQVEQGKARAARRTFASLVRRFPRSRFVREGARLGAWIALRRAARSGDTVAFCARWASLRRAAPRCWWVRRAPHPKPWPACTVSPKARPAPGPGSRP